MPTQPGGTEHAQEVGSGLDRQARRVAGVERLGLDDRLERGCRVVVRTAAVAASSTLPTR